ncbi:hypothetical protein ACGFYQ_24105 [Streptomyces sp. NPDC048258]|uniref:hypothetical protein n=1 Tax=Streptomyces sp. NPDC048258 TaxID=3365527 RepID=UPI003719F50A
MATGEGGVRWNPRSQRWERTERTEPAEWVRPAEPSERAQPSERTDRTGPSDPAERPGPAERPDPAERPQQAGGPEQAGGHERAGRAEQAERTKPSEWTGPAGRAAPADRTRPGPAPAPGPPQWPSYPPSPPSYAPGMPSAPGWRAQGPAAPPPARRRRTLVAVTLGVAVVGAAAVGGWLYLGQRDSGSGPGGPGAEGTATPTATSGPTPTSTSSTGPSGYAWVRETASGFSVAVPTGWTADRAEPAAGTLYRSGDQSALLQIFRATQDTMTACEVLGDSTKELGRKPGYREISRDPVDGSGCELVFEYTDPAVSAPPNRAVERLLVAADRSRWVIMINGPAGDEELTRTYLTAAVQSFQPL